MLLITDVFTSNWDWSFSFFFHSTVSSIILSVVTQCTLCTFEHDKLRSNIITKPIQLFKISLSQYTLMWTHCCYNQIFIRRQELFQSICGWPCYNHTGTEFLIKQMQQHTYCILASLKCLLINPFFEMLHPSHCTQWLLQCLKHWLTVIQAVTEFVQQEALPSQTMQPSTG